MVKNHISVWLHPNLPEEVQSQLTTEVAAASIMSEKAPYKTVEEEAGNVASPSSTRWLNINVERKAARKAHVPGKMKSASVGRYKPTEIGDTVMVPFP